MSPPVSAPATAGPGDKVRRKSLVASITGNALEWYDWNVYTVFAPLLANAVFNPADPTAALLSTFAVFGVGFLMRPVGGMVFGVLADRLGRRTVLVAAMCTTAASSVLVGLTPTHGAVGIWAAVILLVGRLAQGLGHGGESSASYAYVAEIAPRASRGLWSSSVYLSVTLGTLLATGLGAALSAALPASAMAEWGWRVPFLVGGLLGVYALYLRRRAMESDVFAAERTDGGAERPSRRRLLAGGLNIALISASIGVMYYTWIALGVTNATVRHGMAPRDAFLASFLAQLVALVALPLFGWLSDRIGRKPLGLGYALGTAALAFPLTRVVDQRGWTLFVAQGLALVAWAMIASIYSALVSELLPTRYRGTVIGIAGSLANAVFGGSAPYLNTLLAAHRLEWLYTAYLVALCLISAITIGRLAETKGIDLARTS